MFRPSHGIVGLLTLGLLFLSGQTARAGGDKPSLVLWAWERPENLTFLAGRRTAVAFLASTIRLEGGGAEVCPRRQPLRVRPETPPGRGRASRARTRATLLTDSRAEGCSRRRGDGGRGASASLRAATRLGRRDERTGRLHGNPRGASPTASAPSALDHGPGVVVPRRSLDLRAPDRRCRAHALRDGCRRALDSTGLGTGPRFPSAALPIERRPLDTRAPGAPAA